MRSRQTKGSDGELTELTELVDPDELESIMQLILSNLDVSIHRVLLTQSISDDPSAAEPLEDTP